MRAILFICCRFNEVGHSPLKSFMNYNIVKLKGAFQKHLVKELMFLNGIPVNTMYKQSIYIQFLLNYHKLVTCSREFVAGQYILLFKVSGFQRFIVQISLENAAIVGSKEISFFHPLNPFSQQLTFDAFSQMNE